MHCSELIVLVQHLLPFRFEISRKSEFNLEGLIFPTSTPFLWPIALSFELSSRLVIAKFTGNDFISFKNLTCITDEDLLNLDANLNRWLLSSLN